MNNYNQDALERIVAWCIGLVFLCFLLLLLISS